MFLIIEPVGISCLSWPKEDNLDKLYILFDPKTMSKPSIVSGPQTPALLSWSFTDLLDHQVRANAGKDAIISEHQNKAITYQGLKDKSEACASALVALGVKRGDVVAVMLGNRIEYIEVCLDTHKTMKILCTTDYNPYKDSLCLRQDRSHRSINQLCVLCRRASASACVNRTQGPRHYAHERSI